MPAAAIAAFAVVVIAFVSQSRQLDRLHLTAPIVFTTVGAVSAWAVGTHAEPAVVHDLAELTLALILFHDAAQVQPRQLRSDALLCVRLLLVGLPLTILVGFAAAQLLMPGVGVWLALLLGAALAPTDAGLGAATVLNPVVPVRVRRILNVESGLNDGLATPVVLLAIAAAGGTSAGSGDTLAAAAGELALGVLVGVLLGAGSGWLLSRAHRAGHVDPGLLSVGVLAVPLACYYGALAAHGNGFVAAFVSGTAFAAVAGELGGTEAGGDAPDLETTASLSAVLGCAVWALFGILGVAKLGTTATWRGLGFAVLSLTLVRMVPVALALVGSGLRRQTVLFVGWFGPRGLASVVFALIAIESLPDSSELEAVGGAITMTVLLSVVLHGVTAEPWAAAYGRWAAHVRPSEELGASVEPVPGRARPRRARRVR